MKIACEIFADRNYEDDGNLVSRKKSNALISQIEFDKSSKHLAHLCLELKLEWFNSAN